MEIGGKTWNRKLWTRKESVKRAIRHKGRRIRWLLLPGPGNCMQIKCSGGMENLSVWSRSSVKQKNSEK